MEKRGLDAFKARVYEAYGIYVSPWAEAFRTGRLFIEQAFSEANRIGDLTYAAYCCNNFVTNSLAYGEQLVEVEQQAAEGIAFARTADFGLIVDIIRGQLCLIRALRGLTGNANSFDESNFDEHGFEEHLEADPNLAIAACWYWIRKLQALVFAQDYFPALRAAAKAQALLWTSPAFFEQAEYHFYAALAHAGALDTAHAVQPDQHTAHMEALSAHYRQIKIWSEHCPENFGDRSALVGAELARLEGRELEAERLYVQAIRSARANGLIHNEALACETAARFYAARGFEDIAKMYLVRARDGYRGWGANGKARQLEARYPGLTVADAHGDRRAPQSPDQQLDVAAVVKASQTLSGEMLLPNLIERLMTIALLNAGAERGLLILIRDGEPRIEAEAATGLGKIQVTTGQAAVTPSDLPRSVLHYAIRTQERVLLDDASSDRVYSKDEYVRLKRARSVLCLPIVRQANLVGALYLENNLAAGAFTRDRVTVLELLAAQAAISLENAALYTDLQLQVGLLHHLPVSAWTLRPDGTPDFVNQVWVEFAGQSRDFVCSSPEAWMTAVHPEDREIAEKHFWEGVRSGQGFAMETRHLRAKDQTYRWHLNQAVVLRDAEGKVVRFIGTTTDIDDQKRTEEILRQAQADLARINRVTTMGELTASLAHELRQPISGVILNANVSLRRLGSDMPDLDAARADITRIVRDAQRAAEIISRIRAQFEKGLAKREPIDINDINRETVALLRDEAIRNKISVRTELAADLPRIVGDRVQLQQVAMNLIINGIEAMKDVDGTREMVIRSQRAENEQILVSVSDTGRGLPPQQAEQIFDPFFTTKSTGTGMGLRISRSIVESHSGRLWAANTTGRGAVFQFTLPAADRNALPEPIP